MTTPIAYGGDKDWPYYYAVEQANETAFKTSDGQELSDAVDEPIARAATDFASQWVSAVALYEANDPEVLNIDIQGSQKVTSGNPALNHLYP